MLRTGSRCADRSRPITAASRGGGNKSNRVVQTLSEIFVINGKQWSDVARGRPYVPAPRTSGTLGLHCWLNVSVESRISSNNFTKSANCTTLTPPHTHTHTCYCLTAGNDYQTQPHISLVRVSIAMHSVKQSCEYAVVGTADNMMIDLQMRLGTSDK